MAPSWDSFGLSAQEQQELQKLAERKQVKEFMTVRVPITSHFDTNCSRLSSTVLLTSTT